MGRGGGGWGGGMGGEGKKTGGEWGNGSRVEISMSMGWEFLKRSPWLWFLCGMYS